MLKLFLLTYQRDKFPTQTGSKGLFSLSSKKPIFKKYADTSIIIFLPFEAGLRSRRSPLSHLFLVNDKGAVLGLRPLISKSVYKGRMKSQQ